VSATARRLETDEIAAHLGRIRAGVIDRIQRKYPKVARDDLEDAYSQLWTEALTRAFGAVEPLEAWVRDALRHDAIDILRSARHRKDKPLDPDDDTLLGVIEPDRELAGREARGLLHEFLAGLPEQDRLIAYLNLDPNWDWRPERIAAATGIPVREVRRSVNRNGVRLRRFVLQDLAGERCASLTREKLAWIETGEPSLRFQMHLRRCPACRAELRQGRQAVRHALLPLLPPVSIPVAAGGLLARAHDAVLTHPLTIRAQDGLYRWRKLVPV
jgi:DNA-directed RNA polymerase specialized sigma24 family protein